MIIVIHFNIFHVTCLSPIKQKLSSCTRNYRTGDNTYRPKIQNVCMWEKSMSLHKNNVSLVAKKRYMSPKKTETAFVRHKTVALETSNCRTKTQNVCATRAYRRTKHKNNIFVRQVFCTTSVVPRATKFVA